MAELHSGAFGPPTRVLLIRHGEHDPCGRFLQHACEGLTERGVHQARALAARLARDATLTSPVVLASMARRAFETAEVVAEALGVPVAARSCDLCEMHPGAAEGLTPEEMEQRYGPSYAHVPDADHFSEWLPSACAALAEIAAVHAGRQIVALTHTGVIKASFLAFGAVPVEHTSRFWLENTGITEWSSTAGTEWVPTGPWRLERCNDVAHLARMR